MGRHRRSHLPGVVFHLTARTQGHRPWFTRGLRGAIARWIGEATTNAGALLVAYAIMPNHLHIVVRQGERPLEAIMQPLLRRVALLVHRVRGTEGHVFERRFSDRPCLDLLYVRNAIAYAHLNPVRAGLVESAASYPWTSHPDFAGATVEGGARPRVAFEDGLQLFAAPGSRTLEAMRCDYERFLSWRRARDLADAAGGDALPELDDPPLPGGTPHGLGFPWGGDGTRSALLPPLRAPGIDGQPVEARRPAPAVIARRILGEEGDGVPMDLVRSGDKRREAVRVRRRMVLAMDRAGHRGGDIARYLRVSPQCVSSILVAARRGAAGG